MKFFKCVLMFLLIGNLAFAQNNAGALDTEAKALMDKVTDKYSKYNDIMAVLQLEITFPESEEMVEKEVTAYKSGDMFKLNLGDQIIITDGKTVWNYFPEFNEVQINYYEETDMAFSPSNIFTMYEEGFNYRLKEEYTSDEGKVKVMELTPTNKEEDYFKIDLKVLVNTSEILSAKVYFKSGERFVYKIAKFSSKETFKEGFFSFNVNDYKDIEVTDLR